MIERSLPRSTSQISGEGLPPDNFSEIAGFKKHIAEFYRENERIFPWRENITPYRIVVSEIMLQQTGVERVIGKFESFVNRFPDFNAIEASPLSDVMDAWQGLGYNKRALSLKKLARIVVDQYSGSLPDDHKLLKALPGIGDATAGAIMAFAFNSPSVFIETNIRRVFIHHFFSDREKVADNDIIPLVEATVDRSHPREWYYALMDYGTYLSTTSVNPNRKSTRYAKQSRFQDSARQVRGKAIKCLLGRPCASIDDLEEATGCIRERLVPILDSLVKDGLVTRDAVLYRIA
ncbi:MAG: HhH-GPD [Deltaproteobacteria bacterium]|nr:HhH-GPD [Deltaproteobacteria bacterium]